MFLYNSKNGAYYSEVKHSEVMLDAMGNISVILFVRHTGETEGDEARYFV